MADRETPIRILVRFPRTLIVVALAGVLSVLAVRSFPPKPVSILHRVTTEGIGLELRWAPIDRSVPEPTTRCYSNKQLELDVVDIQTAYRVGAQTAYSIGALSEDAGPSDIFEDPGRVLRVNSWSGGTGPNGETTMVFTTVHAGPTVARIRATYPGRRTDEMVPVRGWAAVAVRARISPAALLMGTIEAFDSTGHLIARVDRSSAHRAACL